MSLNTNAPNAIWAAGNLTAAIEMQMSNEAIEKIGRQMVLALGGKLELLDKMTDQGKLLYLLALVVWSSREGA